MGDLPSPSTTDTARFAIPSVPIASNAIPVVGLDEHYRHRADCSGCDYVP